MATQFKARRNKVQSRESGYVLLSLLLVIALLIIAAAVALPSISFDIKRDREEEMIHRGVQYERAIRTYYKKLGRYPTKLEDLENTNNIRYLRKRYKDPITGGDFKLLHFGEVKLAFTGGIGGGVIPGVNAVNVNGGSLNGTANGPQGNSFGGNSAFGTNPANPNLPYGQNQANPNNPQPGSDSSQQDASQGNPAQTGAQPDSSNKPSDNSDNKDQLSGQTFGGGPIIGVASTSKLETIREFNRKKKYSEWQFIYDPGTDRGGLPMTPYQPLQGFGAQTIPNLNGPQNGNFGNGQPPAGMQNNPNLPPTGSFGTPEQPNNPPQQPQQ